MSYNIVSTADHRTTSAAAAADEKAADENLRIVEAVGGLNHDQILAADVEIIDGGEPSGCGGH